MIVPAVTPPLALGVIFNASVSVPRLSLAEGKYTLGAQPRPQPDKSALASSIPEKGSRPFQGQ